MRTDQEIINMFKDMDLETEEKRSRFIFDYSYSDEQNDVTAPFIRADTKTKELMEEKNAELE
jgi:hypothetical protein